MLKKILAWIDDRWPLTALVHLSIDEEITGGTSFAYTLGSATLIVFLLQVITGVWQMFYYVPTIDHAYDSVAYITTNVPFGWLIHGLHYWGANAMIVLVALHLARVFIWGAYKHPRELTWLAGVTLLVLTLAMVFTGAPLPWDERGYWAAEVGTSIAGSLPLIGNLAKELLLGGTSMGQLTLSRFFILHVAIFPAILFGMIGFHLVAFRKFGSVGPWKEERRKYKAPFWPDQVLKDAILSILVFLLLIGLSAYFMPPFTGPADPVDTTYVPKPEWNFLFFYEALKFFPGKLEPFGTIGLPLLGILFLILVPFLDRKPERNPVHRPYAMTIGLILGIIFIALTIVGYLSNPAGAQVGNTASQKGVSAIQISSSAREGRKLFDTLGCLGCHSVNGTGGNVGPNLSNEANRGRSRDWLATQIQDPKSHFPGTVMPAFSTLNNLQINQLVDYLLSLGVSANSATPGLSAGSQTTLTPPISATPVVTETNAASTSTTGISATPTPASDEVRGEPTNEGDESSNEGGPPGLASNMVGSVSHGAVLFENDCSECHGIEGKGGVPNPGSDDGTVPPLNPIDPELASSNPQTFTDNIDRIIQHGSKPDGPNPQKLMPAFGDTYTLTQQEIADIEAYVLQLNHVDRAEILHPGMPPQNFFLLTLAVFIATGVVFLIAWRLRRSG
jgi:ubiquinol-cytochrome c reductase cytochrome b subunit